MEPKQTPNYIGQIVFIERVSGYPQSGEFVVVRQSPNYLHCVSTIGGYGSHNLQALPLVGKDAVTIVTATHNDAFLRKLADDLDRFADPPEAVRHWVESVYTGARNSARLIHDLLAPKPLPTEGIRIDIPGYILTVNVTPAQ